MPSRVTDVIFDLDGTLIDSAPSILDCFSATLAEHGIESLVPMTPTLIGPPLRDTLKKLSGIDDDERLAAMIEAFKRHYDVSGYKATLVFDGVEGMLNSLRDLGLRLHIATNKRIQPTRLILDYLGWSGFFGYVYAVDTRTPSYGSKSEILSALLASESVSPHRSVYVGDRSDDKSAAEANGLAFIAATWGYRDEDLATGDSHFVANNAESILDWLIN